jgi:hypothetical protein
MGPLLFEMGLVASPLDHETLSIMHLMLIIFLSIYIALIPWVF